MQETVKGMGRISIHGEHGGGIRSGFSLLVPIMAISMLFLGSVEGNSVEWMKKPMNLEEFVVYSEDQALPYNLLEGAENEITMAVRRVVSREGGGEGGRAEGGVGGKTELQPWWTVGGGGEHAGELLAGRRGDGEESGKDGMKEGKVASRMEENERENGERGTEQKGEENADGGREKVREGIRRGEKGEAEGRDDMRHTRMFRGGSLFGW